MKYCLNEHHWHKITQHIYFPSTNLAFNEVEDIFHVCKGTLLCERELNQNKIFLISHSLNWIFINAYYIESTEIIWINTICLSQGKFTLRIDVQDLLYKCSICLYFIFKYYFVLWPPVFYRIKQVLVKEGTS